MANTTDTAKNQQAYREKGPISRLLGLPFTLLGILMVALFFSIVSEWVGLFFFWPEEGWRHSQDMLNSELTWISTAFPNSLLLNEVEQNARWIIVQVYEWGFEKTGLIEWIVQPAQQTHPAMAGPQRHLVKAYAYLEDYGLAAVYAVLTLLARVMILILTMPMVLVAVFTGAADGLVRRDLRRFGAGRESGFIYHRAKMLIMPLWVAPWIIYPALPITVNPMLVLLPSALALGLVVSITVGSFKKYL
ncbi:TIGR03747 family integrating conjugative element membrane protein [Pseudomonas asplenii]|uniref:TIGR03747 family integrating conjugative element membrane protein n=1 Tax=Pseudomonas asplenii TaxID=53407 RepID=UPI0006B42C38|nr:TIGR03747 family integrating conjugative element membrane protein [Pseudomonas fuscovaginae]KPA95894.1 integrating conjugative element membrane protein, PFL_4697 family [Pseudomonas fuscovaginae]